MTTKDQIVRCRIQPDCCSIDGYLIGNKYENRHGYFRNDSSGYSAYFSNDRMENFTVFVSADYCKAGAFLGLIGSGSSEFVLAENTTPEFISSVFGDPSDQWQDETELNLTFAVGRWRLEFSWAIESGPTVLRYMSVEQEKAEKRAN